MLEQEQIYADDFSNRHFVLSFQAALFGRQPVLVPAGRGHLVQAGQEEEVQAAAVDGATDGRRNM